MSTSAWDRAGSLPVPASGIAAPEIVALRDELPSVEELFTFMRDAELRFRTLRMRIEEHAFTARGEELVDRATCSSSIPGRRRSSPPPAPTTQRAVTTTSGSPTARPSAPTRPRARWGRPARSAPRPRGLDARLPGHVRVYTPVTALQMETLPDLFVHPAGYCQNVLATGSCRIVGSTTVAGREAIVLECDHPRAIEVAADRPDFAIRVAVDRADGVILRLEESIGGKRDPRRGDDELPPGRPAAADGVHVHVPVGHDAALLER